MNSNLSRLKDLNLTLKIHKTIKNGNLRKMNWKLVLNKNFNQILYQKSRFSRKYNYSSRAAFLVILKN